MKGESTHHTCVCKVCGGEMRPSAALVNAAARHTRTRDALAGEVKRVTAERDALQARVRELIAASKRFN